MSAASYRILITGSRDWTDEACFGFRLGLAVGYALKELDTTDLAAIVIVHGACPTGADAMASAFARHYGHTEEAHPAKWDIFGKRAGPLRNEEMVLLGADICLAFPLPQSRGTVHAMNAAKKAGIPTAVCEPWDWS